MPNQATKDPAAPLLSETLRGGQMWSRVIKRGQRLRISDTEGGAQVAALLFNAERPLERYNMPDTLKAQHIARLTRGDSLFSDMGHVLASIVDDSVGWHDTITGHLTAEASRAKYGEGSYQKLRNDFHRNTRDNLLIELAKYGLGKRDLHANLNLFVKVTAGEDGALSFVEQARAGAYIEFRADMNTLFVLSSTPHPLDPQTAYAPKPAALEVRAGVPASDDDFCRMATGESQRAFALTDAYFA
jgi:urea carboxylase-associated protein 2